MRTKSPRGTRHQLLRAPSSCPWQSFGVDKHDVLARLFGFMTVGSSIIFVSVTFSAYMQMVKLICMQTRKIALEIEGRMNAENHTIVCPPEDCEGESISIIRLFSSPIPLSSQMTSRPASVAYAAPSAEYNTINIAFWMWNV